MSEKVRVATVWLDGCSGCHMSFLDMDERLLDLAPLIDLVYSPLVDHKEYPVEVDLALVEGAVSSEEDYHKIQMVREHTKYLIAMGDCAINANVPSMRNPVGVKAVLDRVSAGSGIRQPDYVPMLRPQARPIHTVVHVDLFLPGCPPSADTFHTVISDILNGRQPDVSALTRFGA